MLRPLLLIGLGGAGGKTLRAIKQQLHQDLYAKGIDAEIPAAWQFLHIDTPAFQDGQTFPAPMLPADQYHSVTRPGLTLKDIVDKVESLGPLAETQKMLSGWSTEFVPVAINNGAAQIRAVGRLALVADLRNTYDAIQRVMSRMLSPTAIPELQAVASTLGVSFDDSTPQVFIISSLGGGTGSGMFTDVAELVKRATQGEWGDQVISLHYTPEIFRSLGLMGHAIPMNSLGAMNELIAAEGTGLSLNTELLYIKCGISPRKENRESSFGSKTNILIRPESGEIDEILLDFGNRFAGAIAHGEITKFLLDLISTHNSQSKVKSDDTELATGLLGFEDKYLSAPEKIFPVWTNRTLVESIFSKMEQTKSNVQTWNNFWEGRRARPITESIPLDVDTRRSMIAGWFIAPLFGMRKIENGPSGRSVKIWNPTLGVPGWSSFPDPLLPTHPEDMSRMLWLLPQLLLSTGVALVKFGCTGDSTFIEGYRQLNQLGSEVVTKVSQGNWNNNRDTRVTWRQFGESTCLSEWIQTGVLPANGLELSKSLVEVNGTQVDRAQALYSVVERVRENYSQLWEEFEDKPWHEIPETWELKEEIDLALKDIGKYAKGFMF